MEVISHKKWNFTRKKLLNIIQEREEKVHILQSIKGPRREILSLHEADVSMDQ